MTKTRITKEEKTAYHEAGHAVIAVMLKLDIGAVTIETTDAYAGYLNAKVRGFERFTLGWMVMALAGPYAQGRRGRKNFVFSGGKEDRQYVGECRKYLRCTHQLMEEMHHGTQKFVNRAWPIIETFAQRLLALKTVSAEDGKAIVESAKDSIPLSGDICRWVAEQEQKLPLPAISESEPE